jgi:hypothetical protein
MDVEVGERSVREYYGICLEELGKTTKPSASRCSSWDSNQTPPEYNSEALFLEPTYFVTSHIKFHKNFTDGLTCMKEFVYELM